VAQRNRRAFLWGVAASLVFHALLFIAFPVLRDAAARRIAEPPGVVLARLVEPAALPLTEPRPPPERAEEKKAEPLPRKPAAPRPKPQAKPEPKPAPRAKPSLDAVIPRSPAPAPESSEAPPPAAPASARAAEPSARSETQAPAAPAAAGRPEESIDLSTLVGRFRVALIREMKRDLNPEYRRLARHAEASGSGEVFLVISESGALAEVRMARSTGSSQLDSLTLQSLRRSKEAVAIPPELHGRRFSLSIPVHFNLKEE
jgi:protein TonB